MITRLRYSVGGAQDQHGTVAPYLNVAAYEWRTNVPDRPDGLVGKRWPILGDYSNGPRVVWYWEGAFRSTNGYAWGVPLRWAYLRMEEEIWNPAKAQWEINGIYYTAPPAVAPVGKAGVHMDATQGQWMVDDLKRSFTTAQIQDMIDASPYDEPDTGAPEAL